MSENKIAILEAGSQYAKLIQYCISGVIGIKSDIYPMSSVSAETLNQYGGIIISGGPDSVYLPDAVKCDNKIFDNDVPILGICYGFQLINHVHGGLVKPHNIREDGQYKITLEEPKSKLFTLLDTVEEVLLTHGDSVVEVAKDFIVTSNSSNGIISSIEHKTKPIYGVQFHPEVELTTNGIKIFRNFVFDICKLQIEVDTGDELEKLLNSIRKQVGSKKVIALVSGGVDSSVCAALLTKAIGKSQCISIHIDTGFLRKKEGHAINVLNSLGYDINVINAHEEFYNGQTMIDGKLSRKLYDTVDPEERRKIIGDVFMKVIYNYFAKAGINVDECLLMQGTLRPDLIESASKTVSHNAAVIKTHHNDTKLVRDMREKGLIIEPLQEFHKNQVRILGKKLDLPDELIFKHPFPGPGLAVRIIVTPEISLEYEQEFNQAQQLLTQINQKIFSQDDNGIHHIQILPIKSVGIQGDCRSFSFPGVARISNQQYNLNRLTELPKIIPQMHPKINRILHHISNTHDHTMEFKLTQNVKIQHKYVSMLREVDDFINDYADQTFISNNVSQMPVILIPIHYKNPNNISIVIRPINTKNFMTASAYWPPTQWQLDLNNKIVEKFDFVDAVFLDLTGKPPGTIEWL